MYSYHRVSFVGASYGVRRSAETQTNPTMTPPARAAARRQRRLVCIFQKRAQIRGLTRVSRGPARYNSSVGGWGNRSLSTEAPLLASANEY